MLNWTARDIYGADIDNIFGIGHMYYVGLCKFALSLYQWCADLEIPSPRNSASASIGSADGPRPQVKLRNRSADRPRPQITTTNELK